MPLSRFSSILSAWIACCVGLTALLTASLTLTGCISAGDPSAVEYRSQRNPETSVSLREPPDMIGAAPASEVSDASDRSAKPASDKQAAISWSAYQRADRRIMDSVTDKAQREKHTPDTKLFKNVQNTPHAALHLEREGSEYWLVVEAQSPEALRPKIEKFWTEQGFELVDNKKESLHTVELQNEVIETQWRDFPSSVEQGFIRSNLSKFLNVTYVTRQKNKYRTRIEPNFSAPHAKHTGASKKHHASTLIFISHTGIREVRTGPTKEISQWELTPHDALLEATYLQRLMQALTQTAPPGSADKDKMSIGSSSNAATISVSNGENKDISQTAKMHANAKALPLIPQPSASVLDLDQSFDRTWFQTGLALAQLNFTVEDKDRARGVYYVRYVDPLDQSVVHQGFWSQLFHGRKEKKARAYTVNVREIQEGHTRIMMLTASGQIDSSLQSKRILALLSSVIHDQL